MIQSKIDLVWNGGKMNINRKIRKEIKKDIQNQIKSIHYLYDTKEQKERLKLHFENLMDDWIKIAMEVINDEKKDL